MFSPIWQLSPQQHITEDGGGGKVKPSFVDFIITCIEDKEENEEDSGGDNTMSQDSSSDKMQQQYQYNRLQDITNENRSGKTGKNVAISRARRVRVKTSTKEEESSENEEGERPVQKSQTIPQFANRLPSSSRSSISLKYIKKNVLC